MAALRSYIAERCGRRDVVFLGIFVRTDGTHIGNIKFEPVDEREGYAVMGILIGDPSWRGKGVTIEVLEASTAWLVEHRGIREVVLGVEREHSAAIHAYEKAGFRIETTQRIASNWGARSRWSNTCLRQLGGCNKCNMPRKCRSWSACSIWADSFLEG